MEILTPHQKAALNYSNHISLTANAGSGKTFVLSKRYLEIALNENIDLRNIAAITFTDKAAGELYKKIAGQIDDKINDAKEAKLIKKLEKIRRQLVSANISTIHSFCIDILREFPVEADLDANFIPIDENLSSELIELSVEELIKTVIKENNEDVDKLKYLIRIFASKINFSNELSSLLKNRKNVLVISEQIYSKTEKEISQYFYNIFFEYVQKIFLEKKSALIKNASLINENVLLEKPDNLTALEISRLIKKLNDEKSTAGLIQLLIELGNQILTSKGTVKKRGYLKNSDMLADSIKLVESFFNDFKKIELTENHERIELELAKFGKIVLYFFNKALGNYNQKKKENGYLDYEDILILTKNILSNSDVQKALNDKFKYLMIDEYQDTNEIQYQIFLPILDYLKTGNLFVVGDEKQSIYMFRDAELEVFDKTKINIKDSSGEKYLLSLPDSFRMSPPICLFANHIFKKLFENPNPLFNEVGHSDLVCAKQDDLLGGVEILIADPKENENAEAELTAKKILEIVNDENSKNNLSWNDIAILVRKRKSFSNLEKAFIKYGIPFVIVGGKGFYQRQTIYDIYNYFAFLLDQNNDAALVGILRSPFFNIPDSKIFEISLQEKNNFYEKLINCNQKNNLYDDLINILKENIKLSYNSNLTLLLRKILSESEYISVVSAKPNGTQEIANIDKLINQTNNFNAEGFNTLYDYVDFLQSSIEQSGDESQAAVSEESKSVKIMTLHQAKGLEFPVVFLFKSDETTQKNIVKAKTVTIDKKFGLLAKVPLNENYFGEYESAPIIGINNLISNKKNVAEIKRLFYVGITRAKNFLFISGENKKNYNYSRDSFLGLLSEAVNINYEDDSIKIKDDLIFLKNNSGDFKTEIKNLSLEIPICKNIEQLNFKSEIKKDQISQKEILLDKINDHSLGEIISASKFSKFKQCPLKYQLTYEYGYSKLIDRLGLKENLNLTKIKEHYDFNNYEDNLLKKYNETDYNEVSSYSDKKGRIIHKILQKEINLDSTPEFLNIELAKEIDLNEISKKDLNNLKDGIISDLDNFYNSGSYKEINKFKNFRNEFEVYVKEKDFYLYGIIDKLIIENDKIIIIDYKTDNISKQNIEERFSEYFPQLKFYGYIISNLFPQIKSFEIRLIFIKYPDDYISKNLSGKDLENTKTELSEMINSLRNSVFQQNSAHCKQCKFSFNSGNCVKNI